MEQYVNVMCFSEDMSRVIVLTKLHGPAFLLNKLNFPGGRIEQGEQPVQAAAREGDEEAGIAIPLQAMTLVRYLETPFGPISTFMARLPTEVVTAACSLTDEPVQVCNTADLVSQARETPEKFCPDFMELMDLAHAIATQLPVSAS